MTDFQFALEVIKLIIPVATILVAFVSYRSQLDAKYYAEFNKRFAEVVELFPGESWQDRCQSPLDLEGIDEVVLKKAVYAYLLLVSEEFFVKSRRFLPLSGWKKWERAIKKNIQSPLFMYIVPKLKKPFQDYPKFALYIEKLQAPIMLTVARPEDDGRTAV